MFVLMGNSNNVPETFVERIFKPIVGNDWRFQFDRETQYSGYGSKVFEYILFNDKGEVVFKGTLGEYQTNELDLYKLINTQVMEIKDLNLKGEN